MTTPIVIVACLIISGCTKLNGVILGQPVSVSPLLLIAVIVALTLVAAILWLARAILQDLRDQRPRLAGGTT